MHHALENCSPFFSKKDPTSFPLPLLPIFQLYFSRRRPVVQKKKKKKRERSSQWRESGEESV